MENMLASVLTVLLFIIGILGLLLFPKSEKRMNGVKIVIMGVMAVLCYLAFCAGICNKLGIFIDLKPAIAALVLMDVLLWGGIIYKRKVQKLFWRVSDIVSLLLLGALVIGISVHIFTPELALQYWNVDAGSHFKYAARIVYEGKWTTNIYFSAYVDAFFIWLFSPVLSPILYFKAFIIADIFMHVLEIWLFYCLIITMSDRKSVRIMAPVFSAGYFFGYPAYSFMSGNFVYWSNGVMILIFIIYALLLIEKHGKLLKYSIPLLLLGAYANTCCNKLFVPINSFALFVALFVIILQKNKNRLNKKMLVKGILAVLILGAAAAGIYLAVWGGSLQSLFDVLAVAGGSYSSMYADLIFFLPALFYVCYDAISQKERFRTVISVSVCMLICTIAMYMLWYNHLMSTYYYYKIYYNLWLCGWLLVVSALDIVAERRQLAGFLSCFGMAAVLCLLTLTDYDGKMEAYKEDYQSFYATKQMFSIYGYNMDSLMTDYKVRRISDQTLDVFNYAMEELAEENVRIITSNWDTQVWHDALDWEHPNGYSFNNYKFPEILRKLDKKEVTAIIVLKADKEYERYQDYYSRCIVVYENQDAAILRPAGEKWMDVPQEMLDASKKELKLFSYVKKNCKGERAALLASEASYYDYIMYYNKTKKISEDCCPWDRTLEETIDDLNENEIGYVVLLKDDTFYLETQGYFDAQNTVYENKAGKVIQRPEGGWPQP